MLAAGASICEGAGNDVSSKGEYAANGKNIVLGILGAFIVFARLNKAPISARFSGTHVMS